MRRNKYTFGVFIGRFQPMHTAHLQVMLGALEQVDRLIVIIGSARAPRNVKNPFSAEERQRFILEALTEAGVPRTRVLFGQVRDYYYNESMWLAEVQTSVYALTKGNRDVALIGHEKDDSSYYLRSFPDWEYLPTRVVSPLNATDLRRHYFEASDRAQGETDAELRAMFTAESKALPPAVARFLTAFRETPDYRELQDEYRYLVDYRERWKNAPFEPIFVTTDAIVIKSGHVLVVRRRSQPGRGKLAMPGGFLDPRQTLLQSCLRELQEETGIASRDHLVPLEEALKDRAVFDYPTRSLRGRTITHAFLFDLGKGQLPQVNPSSDAAEAFWMPVSEVLAHPEYFFEDHYNIIEHFLLRR
ncbi:bifunctional NMN adenylyltransferase/nudix hydrolase [Deinobacterium chartae]|uniref:Bifunctional NMN adenylyltransferase/nudix hydrolase n=1 Tax=Deinobacterium chartae TaxID=521158 RepID=A0A841HYS2_9DEIO|nr:bifunctional nicotinamide-nucleotide adenylyltransferase/Nudix hydroxylase [Deinobacterium chartae]MBB6098701.1 bifunctional NMN adenylyltransferase/nudix hydrolase [Deinobacterium chartae]